MTKTQQIIEEAQAAADKAAALTAFYGKDNHELLNKDPELWKILFCLSGAYDNLAKQLRRRAKYEEEREKATQTTPTPVFAGEL